MKKLKWLTFVSVVLILVVFGSGTVRKLQFGNPQLNEIRNAEALSSFFEALYQLQQNKSNEVSVLHIGDSHIQADFFTGKIRSLLWSEFPQGSKGLAYPYQTAKTNSPGSIRSFSTMQWESRRNVQLPFAPYTGICGMELGHHLPNGFLRCRLQGNPGEDLRFNEVSVLYRPITPSSSFVVNDSIGIAIPMTKRTIEKGFLVDVFTSDSLLNSICLAKVKSGSCFLHALHFRNTQRGGLVYNVAGVNGSQVRNWSQSICLADEIAFLKPKLVVLSFGTNEANDYTLTAEDFTRQLHDFAEKILSCNPGATLLLMTPPDSWYRRKYHNKHVIKIRDAIVAYADEHKYPCWDLFEIMGGKNSVLSWRDAGLAAKDLVHYSSKGYEVQGELFFEAFMKHYKNYVALKSR